MANYYARGEKRRTKVIHDKRKTVHFRVCGGSEKGNETVRYLNRIQCLSINSQIVTTSLSRY